MNDFKPNAYLQDIIGDILQGDSMTLYELDDSYLFKNLEPFSPVEVKPMGEADNARLISGTVLRIEDRDGHEKIFVMSNDAEFNTEYDEVSGRPYFTIVIR